MPTLCEFTIPAPSLADRRAAPSPLDERYPLVPASPAGLAEAAMSCGRRGDVITAPWCSSVQCCARRHHRRPAGVDGVDDLARIDPLQVGAGGPEVGMPELSLDDVDWHPLPGKLDRVRMPQLMLVPTSAQAPLGRPGRYADGGREVGAEEGLCVAEVGIFRVPRGTSGACRGVDSGRVWRRGVWLGRSPAACGSCPRVGRCWSSRVARGRARGR